jgi:hypothetical protein
VPRVALKAEERQLLCQQVIIDGTVRSVASPAVLRQIRMFEDKGPLFFGMALGAGLFDVLAEHFIARRPVGIMAAYAEDLFFVYRVVTGQGELGLHIHVTLLAHARHIVESHR